MSCRIWTPDVRTELLGFLAGRVLSLLQHRPGAFLSSQDYMEMPASKAGNLASPEGSKPVKNKNLFGDKSHFINKNISVPEGPDVSKSYFLF